MVNLVSSWKHKAHVIGLIVILSHSLKPQVPDNKIKISKILSDFHHTDPSFHTTKCTDKEKENFTASRHMEKLWRSSDLMAQVTYITVYINYISIK